MDRPTRSTAACASIALAFALLATLRVTPAMAQTPPPYLLQWGTSGSAAGQFNGVADVAVDAIGRVYVVDSANNRIQVFGPTGSFLWQWGSAGSGIGQFNSPSSIALDQSGYAYVLESGGNRVQKFTVSGAYVGQWGSAGSGNGQFNTPQGICTDTLGNVYVGDTNNHRVQKFTNTGVYVTQWGGLGSATGKFVFPKKLAVRPSTSLLYVTDTSNNRIQTFTLTGTFAGTFGSFGSGNGQFSRPDRLGLDMAGNVYVADLFNNRIQEFSSGGTYLTQWGTLGSGDGQFQSPNGVAVAANGVVYACDAGNFRIQAFGYAGAFPCPSGDISLTTQDQVDVFTCTSTPYKLSVSGAGITNLNGLASLTSVGTDLSVSNNVALVDIGGLRHLVSTGYRLAIINDALLANVDGLAGLHHVGTDLAIQNDPMLSSLAGLDSLVSTGNQLWIGNCSALSAVTGLGSLVSVGTDLILQANAALVSIDGMPQLSTLGYELDVRSNPVLRCIPGLANVKHVGTDINIQSNPLLTAMCGLGSLFATGSIGAATHLSGNGAGCNDTTTITAAYAAGNHWASGVVGFSSEYSPGGWSASMALGPPDLFPIYGDISSAWASATPDDQPEFLDLSFAAPMAIDFVRVVETNAPGALKTVSVKNPNTGLFDVVWSGTAAPAPAEARVLTVRFPMTAYPVNEVRLDLDSPAVPDWNEIDAVAIGRCDCATTTLAVPGPAADALVDRILWSGPNPFRLSTQVAFTIARAGHVQLDVYDILGQRVARLVDGTLHAGRHEVLWDGRTAAGQRAPCGVYYVRLDTGGRHASSRIVKMQ